MRLAKHWQMLDVLRSSPDGVDSVFLTNYHRNLYHKWASRISDTLKPLGYDISEAEKVDGPDWNYRWILRNPSYMSTEEKKARGIYIAPPDASGQYSLGLRA